MNREPVEGTMSGQGSVGAEVRKEPICFSQSCMYSLPGKRPSGLMSGGGLLPLWGMPKKRGMPFRGGWFSIRLGGCQRLGLVCGDSRQVSKVLVRCRFWQWWSSRQFSGIMQSRCP